MLAGGAHLVARARRAPGRAGRDDVDDAALAPWIELREMHLAVWLSLYAEREPAPS